MDALYGRPLDVHNSSVIFTPQVGRLKDVRYFSLIIAYKGRPNQVHSGFVTVLVPLAH